MQKPFKIKDFMPSKPIITIWIHGTMPEYIFPPIVYLNLEQITNFFYCKPGLHRAVTYADKYHHKDIALALSKAAPQEYPIESFYIFGWSGKLDHEERTKAAQLLLKRMRTVIKRFEKRYNQTPYVRIITHSHGGNVALNLAQAKRKTDGPIDELILLAIPVQHDTQKFANDPCFKRVYSLHSHGDLLQVADPQGWPTWWQIIKDTVKVHTFKKVQSSVKLLGEKDLFSDRHFKPHKNIIQAQVLFDKRNLFHIEFLFLSFIENMPGVLKKLNNKSLRDKLPVDGEDFVVAINNKIKK